MIIVPPIGNDPVAWVLGIIIGLALIPLLYSFLDRYVGPVLDRYEAWMERKLSK